MKPYDDKKDYCGPNGCRISRLISRYIFGVDMNPACYDHDVRYEAGGAEADRAVADKVFYADMRQAIKTQMS